MSTELDSDNLTYWILEVLHSHGKPIGAGTVSYSLGKLGSTLSAPTIGRKLRDLEQQGMLSKVSAEGRRLTKVGLRTLKRLEREMRIESSGRDLLKLLKRSSRTDLIDQLAARRTIEGETASLAARHISTKGIKDLEKMVARQREMVEKGETGLPQDLNIHAIIAQASGNQVLASFATLLRSQPLLNQTIVEIRTEVGSRPVVDHEAIVAAIKSGSPEKAREAMVNHIDRLIEDVHHYWEQVFHRH